MFSTKSTVVFLALALACASALPETSEPACTDCPSTDDIVPEDAFTQEETETFTVQKEMLDKAGPNACKKMANTSKNGVRKAKDELQRRLDAFKRDRACASKGSNAVRQTSREVVDATQHQKRMSRQYSKSKKTTIKFGSRSFDSLTKGKCNTFFSSVSYRRVEATVKRSLRALQSSNTRLSVAKRAKRTALLNQRRLRNKCYCAARESYKAFYAKLSQQLKRDQTPSWRKAAFLLCVLRGVKQSKCRVPPLPRLVKKGLGREARNARCGGKYIGMSNTGWSSPYTLARGDQNCRAKYGSKSYWCSKKDLVNNPKTLPQNTWLITRDKYRSNQHFKSNSLSLCSQASGNRWSQTWEWRCNGQRNMCCRR